MKPFDVVEIHSLRGAEWPSMNGRCGVMEWTDGREAQIGVAADEKITLGVEYLRKTGVNVEVGGAVCAVGLHASDWKTLNNAIGRVEGVLNELERVPVMFPPPWGVVPLLLKNIGPVSEGRALLSERAVKSNEEHSGLGYMFREGTLVEVFGLEGDEWTPLNSVTGIVYDGLVQEVDAARVPVAFPEPWGDLPLLVSNIRPAKNAKYMTIAQDPHDLMHGMQLESTTVRAVKTASAAHLAGITPGDRIRAVSNVPVFRSDDIVSLLQSAPQGTSFVVTCESVGPNGVSWNGKVGSKWWGEPQSRASMEPSYDREDDVKALKRCRDCGGVVDLGKRCPVTGVTHGKELTPPPKPSPSRPTHKRYSDASLVIQLADAIDAIERSNVTMYPTQTHVSRFPSAIPTSPQPTPTPHSSYSPPVAAQSPSPSSPSAITRRNNVPLRYI